MRKKNIYERSPSLKPGGTIVFADTPQDDLFTRGFYEPWKDQWLNFDCAKCLKSAGFTSIIDHGIIGGDQGSVDGGTQRKERNFRRKHGQSTVCFHRHKGLVLVIVVKSTRHTNVGLLFGQSN